MIREQPFQGTSAKLFLPFRLKEMGQKLAGRFPRLRPSGLGHPFFYQLEVGYFPQRHRFDGWPREFRLTGRLQPIQDEISSADFFD
jgi:hypothetical protein